MAPTRPRSDVILQPFAGWVRTIGEKFYLHGFHSIAIPTDGRDVTVLFNDIGIGCWAYWNYCGRVSSRRSSRRSNST